jgi:hypothetical protein
MLSIFETFNIKFELELQKWEFMSYEIHFHFVLLGYVHVSYDHSFSRGKRFVKWCAIGQQPKKQTHVHRLISFKHVHTSQ